MLSASTRRRSLPAAARAAIAQWLLRQERSFDHDTLRVLLLAWIGLIGLPFYYVIWTSYFPQHYENFGLRALGTALCAATIVALPALPPLGQKLLAFVTLTYTLPFLFLFLYLMNHGAAVWSQSSLVALIILFHFNARWALAASALGSAAALGVFCLVGDPAFLLSRTVLEQVPIAVFTAFVVSIAKVGRRMLEQEKLAGMAQGLARVSHELRTPLVSVDANVRGMHRLLERARRGADPELSALADALGRIRFEVRHMNHMVDLFLLSATAVDRRLEATETLSMQDVVESTLQRYPFTSEAQRARVAVEIRGDFVYAGQYELSVVVLLNLMRNALKALHRAGKGRVRIIVDGRRAVPRLLFIDTGCGIAADQRSKIFRRFYSHPPGTGSGIGLALCKDILNAWHAGIRCISRELAYTMFVLEFPPQVRLAPCKAFSSAPSCSPPSPSISTPA